MSSWIDTARYLPDVDEDLLNDPDTVLRNSRPIRDGKFSEPRAPQRIQKAPSAGIEPATPGL